MLAPISALLGATLHLYTIARGEQVFGSVMPYWAVEDTTLDGSQADTALGGNLFLNGGPGRTILIRFGDLQRVLGERRIVKSASLMLYQTGGEQLRSVAVSEVLVPWNEGPAHVVNFSNPSASASGGSVWAATHRHRRSGPAASAWAGPGCTGPADAKPIPGVTLTQQANGWIKIDGLDGAILRTQFRQNYGLAIKFDQPCEFASSDGYANRPRLIVADAELPPIQTDLEVLSISRTPWPSTPAPATADNQVQDGLEVPVWNKFEGRGPWPKPGEPISYTGTIRNSGKVPISGYRYRWSVGERWGSWIEMAAQIAPGDSMSVAFEKPFELSQDHRLSQIELQVSVDGDDRPANDRLAVPEVGLGIELKLSSAARTAIERLTGQSAEAFVRDRIRFLNEVAFPMSRFSFAPSGVRERIFLTKISEAADSESTSFEKAVILDFPPNSQEASIADAVCRELLRACGLVDLREADASSKLPIKAVDFFGGLLGGDSRFDGNRPAVFQIPNEPVYDPLYDYPIDAPRMLSMTDVMALESRLGSRNPCVGDYLYSIPDLALYRVTDLEGRPLSGAKLAGYAIVEGTCDLAKPVFEASADEKGILNIPRRQTGTPRIPANPFGRIDAKNRNGGMLIRADYAGQSASTILESWQLVDMRSRAGNVPIVMTLRFRIGSSPKDGANLAKQRIVSDSAGTTPTELAKLCDEDGQTFTALPPKAGAWVEIDLGRDRPVGELELVVKDGNFWDRFDVIGYSTGQTVADAITWIRERGFLWTAMNFGEASGGNVTVRFPAYAQRFRFIRIVSRSSEAAKLAEMRIYGVQQSP